MLRAKSILSGRVKCKLLLPSPGQGEVSSLCILVWSPSLGLPPPRSLGSAPCGVPGMGWAWGPAMPVLARGLTPCLRAS